MKMSIKFFATCLLSCALFFISCSDSTNTPAAGKKDSANKTGQPVKEDGKDQASLEVMATDICDCVSNYESELSDDAKEILMKADRNSEVDTTWKLLSPKDLEIYNGEGKKALNCINGLFKKYPTLQRPDKTTSQKLSGVLKEHCSEFAAALVR